MTHNLPLIGPHITLAQAVKVAGLAGSGGQAKHLVRQGNLLVNDVVETRPGRKLFAGDRFAAGDDEWLVATGEPGASATGAAEEDRGEP